jgi:hypothetical protein
MVTLKLDAQQAWYLTQLLENVLSDKKNDKLFYSLEENEDGDEVLTFDGDFKEEIVNIDDLLLKARGF